MIKSYESTFREETDSCAKQYICALAVYFMIIVLLTFNMIIDRAIGGPGHGKDVVDGLNSTDKRYLREKMNSFSKIHTTACEGLGVLQSVSSK